MDFPESWILLAGDTEKLQREFDFEDFGQALDFVNQVAHLAEAQNHHPQILVDYNKVTLTLWTHSEAKITTKDFSLAEAINQSFGR